MICPTDGVLRAQIDGELSASESLELETHVSECAVCRERVQAVGHEGQRVNNVLAALAPLPGESQIDPAIALARFKARYGPAEREHPSLLARLFARRLRPVWALGAAAVLLGTLVGFAPARTWAQKVLAMLRVQKIAVVPVDLTALSGPDGDGRPGKMIAQVLSDKVVVTHSSKPQKVASADEASQLAGYRVRVLTSRSDTPQFMVEGGQGFQMTLDRSRLQTILNEAGRSDLILPVSADGATISVQVSPLVAERYGTCPARKNEQEAEADFRDCAILVQTPSPVVSVPPDLNIQQLAEVGLQLAGMTADQARSFCQNVDWTSTLVLPVPAVVNSYQTVPVNGVQGTLINLPLARRRPLPGYTLIWIKDGVIYSLTGFGNPVEAVPLAESLN
jgi:anti-sigma factor RsiW